MPAVTKKKAGRPARGTTKRLDLRRHQASTSVRVRDRNLALLHKVAESRELPLSEALELLIDRGADALGVKVRSNRNALLGWS